MDQVNTLFNNLLDIGMGVGVAVSAFFVMWGAFLYMSAAGSPHQMERGKAATVNALAGPGHCADGPGDRRDDPEFAREYGTVSRAIIDCSGGGA